MYSGYSWKSKMAERIRNSDWENDDDLKCNLERYVMQNLSRREILDFVPQDFPHYACSLGSLSRRLAFYNIKYIRYDTQIEEVERAVILREQHSLAVPRDLVHNIMGYIDPEGLERRGNIGKSKR